MKVKLVGSSLDGDLSRQFLTSYVIDDRLAVDAGSVGFDGSPESQERIRHVLISHSHIDHVASLPILVDNVFKAGPRPLTILGSPPVLESLRAHIFNDVVWPDLIRLSGGSVRLQAIADRVPFEIDGLRILPVPVNHIVPTQGFIIADGNASVVFASDTCPTEEIWRFANATPNLKAVFLEVAFPDEMAGLAAASKHLTPTTFAAEVRKLDGHPRIIAVHIKPRFRATILEQLGRQGLINVEVVSPGDVYVF
ncbi:MAG: MBL fold metallo-hydrolase [Isosphaeraceae bacterium]